MLSTKISICLLILYNFGIACGLKSCSDCMETSLCPGIRNLPENELKEKVVESLCGRKKTKKGKSSLMICCSDFLSTSEAMPIFSRMSEIEETENDLENHPNVGLLPENCGKDFGERLGGNYADLYEFPWMALIYYVEYDPIKEKKVYKYGCGGTIITSRHILTAAHCVEGRNIAYVRLGEFDISTPRDCQGIWPNYICEEHLQNVRVEREKTHEEYRKIFRNFINDIAILRVKKDIDFSFDNVKPICLPVSKEQRNLNLSGKFATVAGWGISETGAKSRIPKKVPLPIMEEYECAKIYPGPQNYTFKNLCAGESGKDSCNGDSGGPLMLYEEYKNNYREFQYGILAYGPGNCGQGDPGLYTDVSKYMKWILDNLI